MNKLIISGFMILALGAGSVCTAQDAGSATKPKPAAKAGVMSGGGSATAGGTLSGAAAKKSSGKKKHHKRKTRRHSKKS